MTLFDVGQIVLAAADPTLNVGSGRITGGWEYVWAAYGITWATFALYGLSLWVRRPGVKAQGGGRS